MQLNLHLARGVLAAVGCPTLLYPEQRARMVGLYARGIARVALQPIYIALCCLSEMADPRLCRAAQPYIKHCIPSQVALALGRATL